LDLSSNLVYGNIRFNSNSNLTGLTLQDTVSAITNFYGHSCDLTGTLNLSGLTGLGTDIRLYSNSNLTDIINPISNKSLTNYWAYSCDLGYIDFKNFSGGTSHGVNIQLQGNNMTAAEVNHILDDLDNIGWTGGSLDIAGTNAAPDGTSGGYNGTGATNNLTGKTWTVTTS
jgi:hypothetical protein